ncbi:serine/threonine-protein kinase [Streptomyces zhihengii]|uniref:non-specific serine/threonine protein kinase n=1 Tax=Streptomyces zhihengii TaxID=1818004 RepID=A0ABS2UQN6_9ACTN|nr:serine/threonine-protein kinase [Streptomyces zhihengii]MBM9619861.1 serine/threonine protein kinase [Streptomyces zhihengii]
MEHTHSTGTGLLLAGRYRLGESIGRGGMGKVWRAHDEVLHRVVAVKELTAGLYVAEADRLVLHARTQKEARAAARISHPGVVTVHDVLEHDNRPWIVMQYVDGPSLADAAKEPGAIDAVRAARIGLDVLRALRAAHAAGVLHRDIKPANVLLGEDGRALITDFGIAAIEGDSTITRTGEIVGSIDYLAPERVRGHDPGPASDLWSLGATLYTALEGESPFRRSSPLSTMQAVVSDEPPEPRRAQDLVPVIMALLRKDPAARPSVAETERMLTDVLEGRGSTATTRPVPAPRVTERAVYPPAATVPGHGGGGHGGGGFAPAYPGTGPAPAPGTGRLTAAAPASAPRRGARLRRLAVVVVAAAVIGAGAGFAVLQHAGDKDGGTGTGTGTGATPGVSAGAGGGTADPGGGPADPGGQAGSDVPEGWNRVEDPTGFVLWVPDGWVRQTDGDQIDYTPDNGRHRIRISVDPSPDFENPYMHMLDMEEGLAERLPRYERVKLRPNTFRDQTQSALWEFRWTERKEHPGPRRAIDQMYFGDNGTEYALYMSGPAEDWSETREQFDTMLRGWRPPPE